MTEILQLIEDAQAKLANEFKDWPQRAWILTEGLRQSSQVRRASLAFTHSRVILHLCQHELKGCHDDGALLIRIVGLFEFSQIVLTLLKMSRRNWQKLRGVSEFCYCCAGGLLIGAACRGS